MGLVQTVETPRLERGTRQPAVITPGFFVLSLLGLQGLTVETTTPRALCPTTVAVEEQLAERLQVVGTQGHDWTLELENGHAFGPPAQDFIIVHLFDDHRTLRLEQRIDVTGAACGLRARSVALVVAEYLENSAEPGSPASSSPPPSSPPPSSSPLEPAPATKEPGPSASGPTPQSDASPPAAPPSARPEPNPTLAPWLTLGAAAALVDSRFGGALRVGFRPRPNLELALLGALSAEHREAIGSGSASAHALPLRLSLSPVIPLGRLSAWLGADAFFSYEWAKTEGLPRDRTNDRAVLGFGAQAGLRAPLFGPLRAFAVVAADYVLPLPGSRFEIDGREVLRPGPVRWAGAIGLEIDVLGRR